MEDHIEPWGLRIQIFPSITHVDMDFRQEWEENLQTCSLKMMELLCKQYSNDLVSVDKEIEKLYVDNQSITLNDLFPTREGTLNTDLEGYVTEILKTKEKKCIRDKLAYDNKQAMGPKKQQVQKTQ